MLNSGKSIYFDAEEFDELADYFDFLDETETAKNIVEDGLKIHPQNESLRLKKAKFMLYERRYELAFDYLNNNFSEYDFELYLLKIECLLQMDMYDDAGELATIILNDEDNDPEISYSELGFLYTEADYFDEATYYFEKSLEYNPDNIEVLTELAYVYEMKSDFESAIKISNKILDADPYFYETWVNVGKLYTLQEQFENAIDAFDFALTINESDTDVLKLKAHCLFLCDRTEEAINIFENCVELNPDDESLYYSLSECYLSLEQYDRMIEYLEKYQQYKGETAEILAKKAFAYMQKGDAGIASELIEKGMETDPESEDLNVVAGEFYFLKGDLPQSEIFFLKAYTTNMLNETILDRLSAINIWKNDFEKAAKYLEELIAINPYSPLKNRLALIYFEIGDKERFNIYLDTFSNDELKSLVEVFFPENQFDLNTVTRESLIIRLDDARECRQLFKNIQY